MEVYNTETLIPSDSIIIRTACPNDALELLEIYRPYVTDSVISFEYDVPTLEDFTNRISSTLTTYPYYVAEFDGKLYGYAYASAYKSRTAYHWTVETSIYIAQNTRGSGLGTKLYEKLESTLVDQNVLTSCACIAYPNLPSERFHLKFGYKEVAHFYEVGYKHNEWHDIIWMQKEIGKKINPPLPFIPFSQLQNSL